MSKRVLVACEYSGRVRDAFLEKGIYAMSCDLLPSESNKGDHYQGNVFDIINDGWHMMIAFPPCTHLSKAGAVYWKEKRADGRQQNAIKFVLDLYNSVIPKIFIENPVGILSSAWRKPDQIIQPYQFGEPFKKSTCLWLKNLPILIPTIIIEPTHYYHSGSQYSRGGKTGRLLPGKAFNAKTRSLTFNGIANAIAEQYSKEI